MSKAVDREEIVAKLRKRIVAYAASRMQRDVAEDLAQEVLIVLEEKYRDVEALDELLPLSFRILHFKLLSRRRKANRRGEGRQVAVEDLPLADPAPDPEASALAAQLRQRLRAAIGKLDGRCREIFRLKLEGKTFPEIQGILKAGTLNTVYTWDYRCRRRLLRLLGGSGEAKR